MREKEVACPEEMTYLLFAKWATHTDVPLRKSVDVWSTGIKKGLVGRRQALPSSRRGATCCATTLTAAPAPWCFRLPCPAGVSFRTFDRSPVDAEGRTNLRACAPPVPSHGVPRVRFPLSAIFRTGAPGRFHTTPRLLLLYSTPSITLTSPCLLCCLLYFVLCSSSPPSLFLLAAAALCPAPLALVVTCCYRAVFFILLSIPLSPLPPPPSLPAPLPPMIRWALLEGIVASPRDQLTPARQAPSPSAGPCSASPAPDGCFWRSSCHS